MADITFNGKISEEQLELLKSQHGTVMTIEVPENDEGTVVAVCYVKKPNRVTIGAVIQREKSNYVRAKELLLADIWLAGDERIKNDDELFMSACTVLDDVISVRQADLKKN